jgi:hypothetical protein
VLVSEIPDAIHVGGENIFDVSLANVHVEDDSLVINDNQYELDETSVSSLGTLLDVSATYLRKCPKELIAHNLNYWLRQKSEADALVHLLNGAPRFMPPNTKIIPLKGLTDMVGRVFAPDDEIATFEVSDKLVHLDVISQAHRIEVPPKDNLHRPVNDITHGGIRFRITNDSRIRKPPEVYTYLNRLVCSNGMCVTDAVHKLTLQGKDVAHVLSDMESTAKTLWENLPGVLASYRQTADMEVPGELSHFVHQVGRERGIGQRVLGTAIDRVGELPRPASLYDVIQLFTNIANDENSTYRTRDALQNLGGELAAHPEANMHRCTQCERLL